MKEADDGLRRHEYGDPLKILIDREERSCKGCKFEHSAHVFGKEVKVCTKLLKSGKRRNHGKRCTDYKDKE